MPMFNSYVKLPEGTGYDDITRLSRQISAGIEPIETQITMDANQVIKLGNTKSTI